MSLLPRGKYPRHEWPRLGVIGILVDCKILQPILDGFWLEDYVWVGGCLGGLTPSLLEYSRIRCMDGLQVVARGSMDWVRLVVLRRLNCWGPLTVPPTTELLRYFLSLCSVILLTLTASDAPTSDCPPHSCPARRRFRSTCLPGLCLRLSEVWDPRDPHPTPCTSRCSRTAWGGTRCSWWTTWPRRWQPTLRRPADDAGRAAACSTSGTRTSRPGTFARSCG